MSHPPAAPIRFRQLGTWWGVGLGTLAAGCLGLFAGLVLLIPVAIANAITPFDAKTVATVLVPAAPAAACAAVGFLCGRWWAFTGAVFLLPLSGLEWATEGGSAANVGGTILLFVGPAALLAVGSILRWLYEERRLRRKPEAIV